MNDDREKEQRKQLKDRTKFSMKKLPSHIIFFLKHGETPSNWLKHEYKKIDKTLNAMDIQRFAKSTPNLGSRRN
jgi:hypothetical protein